MSDNFYALELLVREQARWVSSDLIRRQRVALARSTRPSFGRRFILIIKRRLVAAAGGIGGRKGAAIATRECMNASSK